MNQNKKRGFTLIELLAVIVILAIIALIAVPVIMNIINKANKSAFKDTAYGIVSAGELYFSERQLEPNGMTGDVTITLPDDTKTLQIKGEVPSGSILITTEGKIAIAVHNNRYCVTKGLEEKDVTITEDIANCVIPVSITNITLKEGNIVLNKGEEKQIEVIFEPIDATNRTLNYVSSNTSVVTVDLNGKIKAVGKGTSKVTVTTTDGSNISKELNVEVQELVSGIEVNTSSVSIINGGKYQLEATALPETANNKGLSYTSLNESIARVSSTGLITGIAGGETKVVISTTDGTNITKEIDVIVRQQATDITLNKTSVEIEVGESATIVATVLPENTYNKELKWESLDENIATVSNGVVTGVSNGTTKVKVTTLDGSNISKEIDIVVNTPIMTSDNACIQPGNTCSSEDIIAGIKVNVKVNNNQAYDFYILSDNGTELTLIMDRNIYAEGNTTEPDVAWASEEDYGCGIAGEKCSKNDKGPITAVRVLKERTSGWTNIPERTYTYSDDGEKTGYESFSETMRARMLTYTETTTEIAGCKRNEQKSCRSWLYVNLSDTGDSNTQGYWLSTTSYSLVYYMANVGHVSNDRVYTSRFEGIRPVITLTK